MLQIRVIALKTSSPLVQELQTLFPYADVKIQRGVDVRRASTDSLFSAGLITHTVVHSLEHGRKWTHEVPSKGAIGLAHANRLALMEDEERPLLLLEEDCRIREAGRFVREVKHLLNHSDKFDVAVFGAFFTGKKSRTRSEEWLPEGFKRLYDKFWFLHCVLYTPTGRKKVSTLLHKPLEMQIDGLYGSEARAGRLMVIGQVNKWTAYQSIHWSSVQSHTLYVVVSIVFLSAVVVCTTTVFRNKLHPRRLLPRMRA